MNVIINAGERGFDLSRKAIEYLISIGWSYDTLDLIHENRDKNIDIMCDLEKNYFAINFYKHDTSSNAFRTNEDILKAAKKLGDKFFDNAYAKCKIVEIPDDVEWYVECDSETGGYEEIHEKHRVWN